MPSSTLTPPLVCPAPSHPLALVDPSGVPVFNTLIMLLLLHMCAWWCYHPGTTHHVGLPRGLRVSMLQALLLLLLLCGTDIMHAYVVICGHH